MIFGKTQVWSTIADILEKALTPHYYIRPKFSLFSQVDSWYVKSKLIISTSYSNQCGIEPGLTHP